MLSLYIILGIVCACCGLQIWLDRNWKKEVLEELKSIHIIFSAYKKQKTNTSYNLKTISDGQIIEENFSGKDADEVLELMKVAQYKNPDYFVNEDHSWNMKVSEK